VSFTLGENDQPAAKKATPAGVASFKRMVDTHLLSIEITNFDSQAAIAAAAKQIRI
jgi:hypothetical protein